MSLERESHLNPERNNNRSKEAITPHPKTIAFIKVAIDEGVYFLVEEKERKLLETYYFVPGTQLRDLRQEVHPKTGTKVKEIILNSMEKIWNQLSTEAKHNLPKEEVIKLKHQSYSPEHIARMRKGPSERTRKKLSDAGKRTGFPPSFEKQRLEAITGKPRSKKTKDKISRGMKAYRETQRVDSNLWKSAIEENLIGPILNQNLLTKEEIDRIKGYLEGGKEPPEALMNKFSIAVAKVA
jgi:hypothetical protein